MSVQPFLNLKSEDFKLIQPFFKNRGRDISKINTVILHWTAGANLNSDIKTLRNKGFGYHFLIDKEGKVYQGVPASKRVSHGGNSYGPNGNYVNGTSIGISFSMLGTEDDNQFNQNQIDSCMNLILDLKQSLPNLKYISGHHWVSPGRKIDPYTFPFEEFIRKIKTKDSTFELWKTGNKPFPKGLSDCRCIKTNEKGDCIQSTGSCKGPGGYSYSERDLSIEVSDLSFPEDNITT